jgi:acyl carrier protein
MTSETNSETEVQNLVKSHIETELASGRNIRLELDTDLTGIVDSTGVLELAVWIENTFGFAVEIEEITAEDFGSVRALASWIRKSVDKQRS